jgi:hypothetical protein
LIVFASDFLILLILPGLGDWVKNRTRGQHTIGNNVGKPNFWICVFGGLEKLDDDWTWGQSASCGQAFRKSGNMAETDQV